MKKNEKGFSMIEVLVSMVILGILVVIAVPSIDKLIEKSREKHMEAQESALIMSVKSYAEENKSELPKSIGETRIIKVSDLKDANYLTEDLVNSKKESCMKESIVKIYKYDTNKYNYIPYLYCGNQEAPKNLPVKEPKITIRFTDTLDNDLEIAKKNLKSAIVHIKYVGGKDNDKELGLYGHSYIILVQYDNEDKDKFVEIYNSGSLNAFGKKNLDVKKNITKYIDVTKLTNIRVIATAYNEYGGYTKTQADANYKDTDKPICKEIIGQAIDENDWTKGKRTIKVKCDDGLGSGCKKDVFTNTFYEDTEYGIIQIVDNVGNTTDCRVRVNIDRIPPSCENITKLSDGTNYTSGRWVNTNAISTTANCKADNLSGCSITKKKVITSGKTGTYESDDKKLSYNVTEEGTSSTTWYVYDKAGNEKKCETVTEKIDRTKPTCDIFTKTFSLLGEYGYYDGNWTKQNVYIGANCSDAVGECTEISKGLVVSTSGSYSYQWNFKDQAGNEVSCSPVTVKIDNLPPICTNDVRIATGAYYTSKNWTNQDVYTTAYCSDGLSGCSSTKKVITSGATRNTSIEGEVKDSWTVKAEGKSTTTWYVYDNVGNEGVCEKIEERIDKTPPTCGAQSPNNWTNGSSKTISVGCNDNRECSQTDFSKTFSLSSGNTCKKTGTITISDKAGNEKDCSVHIGIDTAAPVVSCSGVGNGDNNPICKAAGLSKVITCSYSDNCSGINIGSRNVSWAGKSESNGSKFNGSLDTLCSNVNSYSSTGKVSDLAGNWTNW